MNKLKEKSIKLLCEFGKFGIGKSLTLGFYDFEIPKKLIQCGEEKDNKKLYYSTRVKKV